MGDMILYRSGGGSGIGGETAQLGLVRHFSAVIGSGKITLTWVDPDDIYDGGKSTKWTSTRIVRKSGSTPKDENDGTVVVESRTKNQYRTSGYNDSGLTNGITYYYAAFPCSSDGIYSKTPALTCGMPEESFKTMSVVIEFGEDDPATMCTYDDDAVDMPSGKSDNATTSWQKFFGYRPCLMVDGVVVAYLSPDDYTKTINGDAVDLSTTDCADVMVEFPRKGIKLTQVYSGNNQYKISMTNDPNASGYTYYAHTRGSSPCNNFYISAYNGSIVGDRLRSVHGSPHLKLSNETYLYMWRNYAHNNGTGYELMTWYQVQFLRYMYMLQFKNTNSQEQVGYGYTGRSSRSDTLTNGTMDKSGMIYGSKDRSKGVKLFGIENLWGNSDCFIDGLVWARHGEYDNTKLAFWYSATHNFTLGDPERQEGTYSNWGYDMDTEYECESWHTAQTLDGYFGFPSRIEASYDPRYIFLFTGNLYYYPDSSPSMNQNSFFCDTSVGGEGTIDNDDLGVRSDHPYVGTMPLVSGSSIYTTEVGIFYMDRIDSVPDEPDYYNGNKYPILVNARISYYHD